MSSMSKPNRTAAEAAFWDIQFRDALADQRKKNGRSHASKVNTAAGIADLALEARRRSVREHG